MASPIRVPLAGYRFGKLLVVRTARVKYGKHKKYECLCECGRKVIVQGNHLRSGNTVSCGCSKGRGNGSAVKAGKTVPLTAAVRRSQSGVSHRQRT